MLKLLTALSLLLLINPKVYCQHDFFYNNPGISGSYYNIPNKDAQAIDIGISSKNGLIGALGYRTTNNINNILAAFMFCPHYHPRSNKIKPLFGLTYLYDETKNYASSRPENFIGIANGYYKVFFPESSFPFSIRSMFSIYFFSITENSHQFNFSEPILDFEYSQAFFTHNTIFPYFGIKQSFDMELKENAGFFTITFGLIIKTSKH